MVYIELNIRGDLEHGGIPILRFAKMNRKCVFLNFGGDGGFFVIAALIGKMIERNIDKRRYLHEFS